MVVMFKLLTSVSGAVGRGWLNEISEEKGVHLLQVFSTSRGILAGRVSKSKEKLVNCFCVFQKKNIIKLKLAYAGIRVKVDNCLLFYFPLKKEI